MRTRGGRQARTGVPGRTAGRLTVRKAHFGQVDSYGRDGQGAWCPVAPRATGRSRRREQRGRPSGTGLGDRRLQPQMAQDPTDHRRILHDRDQREAPPAGRTGEHVDTEAAPHQLRPMMIVRRRGTHGTAGGLFRGVSRNPRGFRIGMDGDFRAGMNRRIVPDHEGTPRGARRQHPVIQDQVGGASVPPAAPADRAVRTVRAGGRRAAGRGPRRAG